MYLTEVVAQHLFASLAELAAPGSRLAANFAEAGGGSVAPGSRLVARAIRLRWRLAGEPTHYWAERTILGPLLTSAGWTPGVLLPGPTLAATHLAPGTPLATAPINPKMLSLTAHRPRPPT